MSTLNRSFFLLKILANFGRLQSCVGEADCWPKAAAVAAAAELVAMLTKPQRTAAAADEHIVDSTDDKHCSQAQEM